ncbi:MAG TPA: hypothetical protein VKA54_02805, partial [Gemmatimonadaceae bacterium]|nr:hypothetical protein [Gemmatimonadaceae bacterium]
MSHDPADRLHASDDQAQERRKRRTVANLAIGAIKAQHAAHRSKLERFADGLNNVASSTPFLVLHVLWFSSWIGWNSGVFPVTAFDPFP